VHVQDDAAPEVFLVGNASSYVAFFAFANSETMRGRSSRVAVRIIGEGLHHGV